MIKKSYRKEIHGDFSGPPIKEIRDRFTKLLKFLNEVFSCLHHVPEGFYKCSGCNAEGPIRFENPKRAKASIYNTKEGNMFGFACCEKCKGTGYVDFISNVIKKGEKIYWHHGYSLPTSAYEFSDHEIASIIFYLMYNEHDYKGFNINFKDPTKNMIKNKKIKNFIDYFIEYKKTRDNRIKFIEKNFEDLQKDLLKSTKVVNFKRGQHECNQCKSKPFNIYHNNYHDTIELGICGKCYGQGYQTKKDTFAIVGRYNIELETPNYSNKKKMLSSILFTADYYLGGFILQLGQIDYREKQLKKRRTITA